jgi:hypothetical protein
LYNAGAGVAYVVVNSEVVGLGTGHIPGVDYMKLDFSKKFLDKFLSENFCIGKYVPICDHRGTK